MVCGSGGSNSRLAKAAGAEPSGEMRDEELHAVVVKMLKNTANIGALLEVEMSKKCTPLWRKAHFQVKMYKASQVLKNCAPLWREAHFEVKSVKN